MAFCLKALLGLLLVLAAGVSAQVPPASSSYNLVLIFVDFKDGRKPDGSHPTSNADLRYFNDTTINAVGGIGYVNVNPDDPPDPRSPKRRMIRKYVYEDYWDMYFTEGTYAGKVHPDYASHGVRAYGSLLDYYKEATYGKVQIRPYQTWPETSDKYHVGIANRYDESGGKKYVRWITISASKKSTDYSYPSSEVLDDARSAARAAHALLKGDPEYIPFDIDSYLNASPSNKVIYVGAGGNKSGFARGLMAQDIWLTEKSGRLTRSNAFPASTLEGIQGCVHEFGHLLGVEHFLGGSYDPMSWGGVGPDSNYYDYDYCPPHFNPLVKLKMGWIPGENIIRVSGSRTVSLPPIDRLPAVALITIYGDAGRNNDYSHSEYLLVEYRKREGFNRFSGGISTPGFDGGALIWHYSNYHPFPVNGQIVNVNLGLKVRDFGMRLKGDPGSPSDFFWEGNSRLDPETLPGSNSAGNFTTGIRLSGFVVREGKLEFKVTYTNGNLPKWDGFFTKGASLPRALKGKVYAEATGNSPASLALQKSDLYLSPGSALVTILTATGSKIHLFEDATCTAHGSSSFKGRVQISGRGTFAVDPNDTLRVYGKGRVDVSKETRVKLAPGMSLFLGSGSIINMKGKLEAPDSVARRIRRLK